MWAHAPAWLVEMWPAFAVACVCLVTEMFFAAAELSVISCDRIALRKDAEAGQRPARLLEQFLDNKQRFLATTLLGTQMSVIVSTVTMTYALHKVVADDRAELYLLALMTPVLVIFGEIVPKTIGQQSADRWARRLVYPLWLASKVFSPVVAPLTKLSTAMLKKMHVPERKLVTREELELLLKTPSVSMKRGEITEGERRMISRIFDFTDTTVADVMMPLSDVVALSETADLATASRQIEETQYTRFPVFRERVDRVVGTVHAFDILKAGRSEQKIGALARAPIFVPGNQPAVDLLVELQRARQGMAIVVDEYGGAGGHRHHRGHPRRDRRRDRGRARRGRAQDPQGGRRCVAGQRAHVGGRGQPSAARGPARGRGVRERRRPGAGEAAPHPARRRERPLRQRAGQGGQGQRARRRRGAGAPGQAPLAGARTGHHRLKRALARPACKYFSVTAGRGGLAIGHRMPITCA
jgi:putative hemolysin